MERQHVVADKKRLQVAVVGPGRLGLACALALLGDDELALAGLVGRQGSARVLPNQLRHFPLVEHIRDLPPVDLALLCVPSAVATEVAHDLLQCRVPLVECAQLKSHLLAVHHESLDGAARRYRVSAVIGAGWDPGMFPLLGKAFNTLIPQGQTVKHEHPGLMLHHSQAVEALPGVRRALEGEVRASDGELQRYVYVEVMRGADFDRVRASILSDPIFAGEITQVFQIDNLDELEAPVGQGLVIERHATAAPGVHASLILEARFDIIDFAARVMLKACRRLPTLPHGAHRFSLEQEDSFSP